MEIRRGDIVTIAISGDYGKPRPALVIQDDAFRALPSLVVLRLTSALHDSPLFRIAIEPDVNNGLQSLSQVMIDKPAAVPKSKIGRRIGYLDKRTMDAVDAALVCFIGLG
jgi:mRNA interferase MazF